VSCRGSAIALSIIAVLCINNLARAQTYMTLNDPSAQPDSTTASGVSGIDVVGYYNDTSTGHFDGFSYNGSTYTTMDYPAAIDTKANGISGSTIVGTYITGGLPQNGGSQEYGFSYNGSTYSTLAPPSANTNDANGGVVANAVFESNVVGTYYNSGGTYSGFLYNGSTYTTLNVPSSISTYAQGISGGNVVGYFYNGTFDQGFLYNGSTYTTLDYPSAEETFVGGIDGNNIVGSYQDASGYFHGFLYNGSTYTTLDYPNNFYGTEATSISGNSIVGIYFTGLYGEPYSPSGFEGFIATVPEPGCASLLGLSSFGLLIRRRRKRSVTLPTY
jgi:hypothetical protein